MTNKLHPQELADLLNKYIAMDQSGEFFAFDENPIRSSTLWLKYHNDTNIIEVTHAIAKPEDCPEWDEALWEPRVRTERGQLCEFRVSENDDPYYGYYDGIDSGIDNTERFRSKNGSNFALWKYCKTIDSVPSRIDLDAQRSE